MRKNKTKSNTSVGLTVSDAAKWSKNATGWIRLFIFVKPLKFNNLIRKPDIHIKNCCSTDMIFFVIF